jgi:hypothetical protein
MLDRGKTVAWATAIAFATALGCGQDGATDSSASHRGADRHASQVSGPEASQLRRTSGAETVAPSRCPPALVGCRAAKGRITFVERVDPDGDGDAHFVIADSQGITLPGLTAIDVRRDLRPNPLPEVGDLISAAGPVQTGSYGQDQIHAIELHVADPGS